MVFWHPQNVPPAGEPRQESEIAASSNALLCVMMGSTMDDGALRRRMGQDPRTTTTGSVLCRLLFVPAFRYDKKVAAGTVQRCISTNKTRHRDRSTNLLFVHLFAFALVMRSHFFARSVSDFYSRQPMLALLSFFETCASSAAPQVPPLNNPPPQISTTHLLSTLLAIV